MTNLYFCIYNKKGKGYKPAEESKIGVENLYKYGFSYKKIKQSYSQVFGETLSQLAGSDEKIIAITAAICLVQD